jgi:hypothetical protein
VIKVAVIKKGAKGTWLLRSFFFERTRPIPIIPPRRKVKNNIKRVLGQERNKPRKKTSFTSPKPSHLPPETKKITKKNKEAPRAERREITKGCQVLNPELKTKNKLQWQESKTLNKE